MAKRKRINLALQGGGSHGAVTWGALDAILEDGRLEVAAISGASAGAMNAVALAQGLTEGGPGSARCRLEQFWTEVGRAARISPYQRGLVDVLAGGWGVDRSPAFLAMDMWSRLFSPYDIPIGGWNPLREVLETVVDFEAVRHCGPGLFIAATDVETGRGRIFTREEVGVEQVLASAALPDLYRAVEIDERAYWDGGYAGNPPLYPFFDGSDCDDILMIQLNPIRREGVPRTAREIADRLNEITFNTALVGELRAIDFVRRLIDEGRLENTSYRRMRLHMIEAPEALLPLGAASKLNAEKRFLKHLFEIGRAAGKAWLEANAAAIGQRDSLNIPAALGRAA